jgi:hypothetical protein
VKIKKFSQMFRPLAPKLKSWVFVTYVIMVAYLIVDGPAFMYDPYSGRLSTLVCRENKQGASECKITIYGFTEIYQRSFLVKNVRAVFRIHHFPLATSDSLVCGITIITYSEKINFVHPYQKCDKIDKTVAKINYIFTLGEYSPAKRITYVGFNSSIYQRALLLVVGFLIALLGRSSWSLVPMQITSQVDNIRVASRRFIFSWLIINILLKVFFYLTIGFVAGYRGDMSSPEKGDAISSYLFFLYHLDFSSNWCNSLFGVLLCIYPLIAFAILQAYVQWKFLEEIVPLSGWWIGAPVIAGLTLVFGLPAELTYQECIDLKLLLSGFWSFEGLPPILWNLIIYLLLVGIIQWSVLRRRLSYSIGWIFMPLITVSIVPAFYGVIQNFSRISTILALILVFIFFAVGELILSIYLSWVIYSKNSNDEDQ